MYWDIEKFNDIQDWWTLRDFCEDYDVEPDGLNLQYLRTADDVAEVVRDLASSCRWDDIRDYLANLWWNGDHGEIFIESDDSYSLREIDGEDFESCKEQILNNLHNSGVFLDGEREEEEEEEEEEERDDPSAEHTQRPLYIAPVHSTGLYGNIVADSDLRNEVRPGISESELMNILSMAD